MTIAPLIIDYTHSCQAARLTGKLPLPCICCNEVSTLHSTIRLVRSLLLNFFVLRARLIPISHFQLRGSSPSGRKQLLPDGQIVDGKETSRTTLPQAKRALCYGPYFGHVCSRTSCVLMSRPFVHPLQSQPIMHWWIQRMHQYDQPQCQVCTEA